MVEIDCHLSQANNFVSTRGEEKVMVHHFFSKALDKVLSDIITEGEFQVDSSKQAWDNQHK